MIWCERALTIYHHEYHIDRHDMICSTCLSSGGGGSGCWCLGGLLLAISGTNGQIPWNNPRVVSVVWQAIMMVIITFWNYMVLNWLIIVDVV
jgi:hypothetical protein